MLAPVTQSRFEATAAESPVLTIRDLRVELTSGADIVSDISLEVRAGEIVGLVGESGSGKTTIAAALLAHVREGARIAGGQVWVDGKDLLTLDPVALRRVRGRVVSYVAQDPATALNPVRRIGDQLLETLRVHEPALERKGALIRLVETLQEVGLPARGEFLQRFPHQLSGGQQQRVLLALAFLLRPKLVVLDEPTTALDVATQAKILTTVRKLCTHYRTAALYVSHDLAVVSQLADRVVVLYAGRIVEHAPSATLFTSPRHPYTRALLEAIPDVEQRKVPRPIPGLPAPPGQRVRGCAFAPRCSARSERCTSEAPPLVTLQSDHRLACFHPCSGGLAKSEYPGAPERPQGAGEPLLIVRDLRAGYARRRVLEGVSLEIAPSECVALVGESGSGKTTLARALAGLGEHRTGELFFAGQPLPFEARRRSSAQRSGIQYVFQNPHRALNPRRTVGEILRETLKFFFPDHPDPRARVDEVLTQVALRPDVQHAHPRSLSGGECQRVAIARALVCAPKLIICDEVTSALDVSVQATILELLRSLQKSGLAILFVTHDIGVVRSLADRVLVLHEGRIVEAGERDRVLDQPQHAYTRALLQHTPRVLASAAWTAVSAT